MIPTESHVSQMLRLPHLPVITAIGNVTPSMPNASSLRSQLWLLFSPSRNARNKQKELGGEGEGLCCTPHFHILDRNKCINYSLWPRRYRHGCLQVGVELRKRASGLITLKHHQNVSVSLQRRHIRRINYFPLRAITPSPPRDQQAPKGRKTTRTYAGAHYSTKDADVTHTIKDSCNRVCLSFKAGSSLGRSGN
ncbi:hypothetical protein CEXT_365201 [Caerostris extrusa]|uniref:Uncharacterized protein n=1 Tax=Caerostris extrusa TaxID=172846 RepID=A0AAV4VC67_CAEEX|nr:hypothetical protein CEXT_365201 [Caerostris extrusa]